MSSSDNFAKNAVNNNNKNPVAMKNEVSVSKDLKDSKDELKINNKEDYAKLIRWDILKLKDRSSRQLKNIKQILAMDPSYLKDKNVDVAELNSVFSQIEDNMKRLDDELVRLDNIEHGHEIMNTLVMVAELQKVLAHQVEVWRKECEKGYDFIRHKLIPSHKHVGLRNVSAIHSVDLPDTEIEKEFMALDGSMHGLTSSYLVTLADALTQNIEKNRERHGDHGMRYIKDDLQEHIHLMRITLQHIARKENKLTDPQFVEAYRAIEYLLILYKMNDSSLVMLKKAVDDVLLSLKKIT